MGARRWGRAAALVLLAASGCGRESIQRDGPYAVQLLALGEDGCGLVSAELLPSRLELEALGELLTLRSDVRGVMLAGRFRERSLGFVASGSKPDLRLQGPGHTCSADLVTWSLVAKTASPQRFEGVLQVRVDGAEPSSCECRSEATVAGELVEEGSDGRPP